jgi:hypothetical protein
MRLFVAAFLVMVGLIGGPCLAADVKVAEVIEIGPCGGGPLFRPVKWSPDGSMIAYFNGQKLMVADTLGKAREVFTIDYVARPFEWISDSEIVLYQREFNNEPYRMHKLSIITLSGIETVLAEEKVPKSNISSKPSFSPPHKTLSGIVYYESYASTAYGKQILTLADKNRSISPSEHHYVTMVGANLYKISLGGKDTSLFLSGRYSGGVVNTDYSMFLAKGEMSALLYNLKTKSCDTIYPPKVQNRKDVYCGVMGYEFNPANNHQVIYFATCDDGHYVYTDAVCLYDYDKKQSIVLSPMTESKHELSPMFSPNGRFFSFIAEEIGVCIARLEVK